MDRYSMLSKLIDDYKAYINNIKDKSDVTEETIRSWINEFLNIFDWDVKNTDYVLQEIKVSHESKAKLKEIGSSHTKPDYTLRNGNVVKAYLDTKSLDVNLRTSDKSAYQIKCYGWSAGLPCSFITNFEEFVVYDCNKMPNENDDSSVGAYYMTIDDYLDNFPLLEKLLLRENVINGSLEKLYDGKNIDGKESLDVKFNKLLCDFRINLAQNLIMNNFDLANNNALLNYYTQIILDRIIFIRVCESKELEEIGLLKSHLDSGEFWDKFKNSCYLEFYHHYDGAMFERDSFFQKIALDNDIFHKFINGLYYPYPYKFDAIPTKVLSKIYEDFLDTELIIKNNKVELVLKDEYVKSNGAIPTPNFIVEEVCEKTIDLSECRSLNDIFNLSIFDPCCGSGIFLVATYEILARKAKEILRQNYKNENQNYWVKIDDNIDLTVAGKVQIIASCLNGIDYDDVAIEVTKMSLALKIIDDYSPYYYKDVGLFGSKILSDIDKNIVLGNTLFDYSDKRFTTNQVERLKIINFSQSEYFHNPLITKGGFDYIVGNPPYVETKHYKKADEFMHGYLREKYSCFHQKADLSVIFIERCISLLNHKGKMGFIVQRRWFKTNYGKKMREKIAKHKLLSQLYDINTSRIFEGRTTYVSILVLSHDIDETVNYSLVLGDPNEVKVAFECDNYEISEIPQNYFESEVWSPESYEVEKIKLKMINKHGTIKDDSRILIKDGIQALYKKIYHIKNCHIDGDTIKGVNGLNEEVQLDLETVKPVLYNKTFYPLKKIEPSAYSIFPYQNDYITPIPIDEMISKYPLTHKYLKDKKVYIESNVRTVQNDKPWYIFTREHNHKLFNVKKIIVPMTALETIAAYEPDTGIYMDNSNMWFITLDSIQDDNMYKALTMIINSTIFSVFGKAGANPQANDYYKLNKQYLEPIPFPSKKFHADSLEIYRLATLFDEITETMESYIKTTPNKKQLLENQLKMLWTEVDDICNTLYEIDNDELNLINAVGRISNIELMRNEYE